MDRLNQRQGFLVSAIVHLLILSILGSRVQTPRKPQTDEPPSRLAQEPKVFLPPREVLRQLAPRPSPSPVPPKSDRISIGRPTSARAKDVIELRRGVDITQTEKGLPNAPGGPAPAQSPPTNPRGGPEPAQSPNASTQAAAAAAAPRRTEGLIAPPGLGELRRGTEGLGRPGTAGPSIASSIKRLEQRLQVEGPRGLPNGAVQELGGLAFDPQGADFTQWINHFGNEAYRNWIVPEAVYLGFGGQCEFEFTVERDGTVSDIRLLRSAGPQRGGLDRAARNALLGSRLLPLPADYPSPRVVIRVIFSYGQGPQGS